MKKHAKAGIYILIACILRYYGNILYDIDMTFEEVISICNILSSIALVFGIAFLVVSFFEDVKEVYTKIKTK